MTDGSQPSLCLFTDRPPGLFDDEVRRAYFVTQVFDFHADGLVERVKHMDESTILRLLRGRITSIGGLQTSFSNDLKEGVEIILRLENEDLSLSESQMIQYSKRSRLIEAVTEAAVIRLGVAETFRLLNPLGQKPAMLATSSPDAPKWALALASYMGEVPIVKALLSRNAELRTTKAVSTALPLAAGRGHLEMVQLLLDGGADVNYERPIWSPLIDRLPRHCRPIHYGTALEAACASLLEPVITLLLQSPQNVAGSSRAFHNAVRIIVRRHDSDAETLQNLVFLLLGAVESFWARWLKFTLLCDACEYGHKSLAQLFLNEIPKVNSLTEDGRNPVSVAAEFGQIEIMKILLARGARQGLSLPENELSVAAYHGHLEIVKLLLPESSVEAAMKTRGYNIISRSFIKAATAGHVHVMEFFLQEGLGLATDDCGEKALYAAATGGHKEAVCFLLSNGVKKATVCREIQGTDERVDRQGFELVERLKREWKKT